MRTAISLMITGLVFSSLNVNFYTFKINFSSQLLFTQEQLHTRVIPRRRRPHRGSGRREMLDNLVTANYAV